MRIGGQNWYTYMAPEPSTESARLLLDGDRFQELMDIMEQDSKMYKQQAKEQQKINEENRLKQKKREKLLRERAQLMNQYYLSLRRDPRTSLLGQISILDSALRRL